MFWKFQIGTRVRIGSADYGRIITQPVQPNGERRYIVLLENGRAAVVPEAQMAARQDGGES